MNKNQKLFLGISLAGIAAYVVYKKFLAPPATASFASFAGKSNRAAPKWPGCRALVNYKTAKSGSSNYAGYINATGGEANTQQAANTNAKNTVVNTCQNLINTLVSIRKMMQNPAVLAPSQFTTLKNNEMAVLAKLQQYNCIVITPAAQQVKNANTGYANFITDGAPSGGHQPEGMTRKPGILQTNPAQVRQGQTNGSAVKSKKW